MIICLAYGFVVLFYTERRLEFNLLLILLFYFQNYNSMQKVFMLSLYSWVLILCYQYSTYVNNLITFCVENMPFSNNVLACKYNLHLKVSKLKVEINFISMQLCFMVRNRHLLSADKAIKLQHISKQSADDCFQHHGQHVITTEHE